MPRIRTLSDEIVLERAMAVFWRNGYAGTSLRDLTKATGLSNAALYHRFGDKDGLFVEVLRRYGDEGLTRRLARHAACDAPLAAIRAFLDELVALTLDDQRRCGCLLVNTALDGGAMSQEARRLVRDRFGAVEAFFAESLERAVSAGDLPPETDVAATATALLGTVFAIRVLARLDPDPARLRALVGKATAGLAPAQDIPGPGLAPAIRHDARIRPRAGHTTP